MGKSGGAGTWGLGPRRGTAMVLAGLLLAVGNPAQATTTDPGDQGAPVDHTQTVPDQGTVPAPAPPAEEVAVPAPGPVDGEQAQPAPPPNNGLYVVDGFIAGGHGTGPTTFTPLLGDETYPVPAPPENPNLPEEVDELGPFVRQVSCDPADQPGITAFAMLVFTHYDRPGYFGSRPCVDYMSFHHDGRALDWSVSAYDAMDRRIADSAILWLTENDGEMAARFGIENIIWNFQIWDRWSGWQHYAGHPHDDHVHFAFTFDGAQARTSWWTGVALRDDEADLGPCPTPDGYAAPRVYLRLDTCDPATGAPQTLGNPEGGLAAVQQMLGVEVTGELDEDTRAGLLAWQMEHELPVTGLADTWTTAALQGWDAGPVPEDLRAALPQPWELTAFTPYLRTTLTEGDTGPAVVVLQEAIGAEPDGDFGPLTAQALREWEESVPVLAAQLEQRGEEAPAAVTPLTWLMLQRATHPTISVRHVELAEGSLDLVADPDRARLAPAEDGTLPYAGGAVTVLQQLLDVEVDGDFGPQTAAAVREVQEAAGLEPTGVVDGPTWVAVEAAAIEAEILPGPPGLAAQREREAAEAQRVAEEQAAAKQAAADAAAFEASLANADR